MEDVVGGDFAGDLAEVVEYLADILANKIRRDVVVEGCTGRGECLVGSTKGSVMAHV